MSTIIALAEARQVLKDKFGDEFLICLQPKSQEEIGALDEAGQRALWCVNLGAVEGRGVIMRQDAKFFDIVFLADLTYPQPAVEEEPGKRGQKYVGPVVAAVAVKNGEVYVLTQTNQRDLLGLKVVELPRRSISNQTRTIPGVTVGEGGYANTARIIGRIEDRGELVPEEVMGEFAGWVKVEEFLATSLDRIGKSCLIAVLVELNLVRFGR